MRFSGLFVMLLCAIGAAAQAPAPDAAAQDAAAKQAKEKQDGRDPQADDGVPIDNELVKQQCGACHRSDDKGRMSRISYRRTTPEGWHQTIKRMVALNAVELKPEDARAIVKYLSNRLGLAPEEARPGMFESERRMIEYKYAADADTERTCNRCHSFGRVLLQRRTKQEWELLMAMHRGYYPLTDFQAFRRMGPPQTQPGPDGRPPDNRHPMEKALAHLSGAFPMKTAEWAAWTAAQPSARLEGKWILSGNEAGKGPFFGEMTVRRNDSVAAGDEFLTEIRYTFARSGQTVSRTGKSILYAGFQWRGRSSAGGADELREVLLVERNRREMSGRWFSGAYDERGLDVKLVRAGGDVLITGVGREALRAGADKLMVWVYGANFPKGLSPRDVDFGPGVTVSRVVDARPDSFQAEVAVAANAVVGRRDLSVAGTVRESAVVVFDKIHGLKVRPQAGMARVGGVAFPKQLQQFEAFGYHNGPDGKPDTKDDLDLGVMEVKWSIEEFTATFGDDDREFVGTIDAGGLFTPAVDGPNPKRRNSANNFGDVWVVATMDNGERPLRARAHLLVTVPLYMKWDQPEVSK